MGKQIKVGIIGCGNIAPQYIRGNAPFSSVRIAACADLDVERAQSFGREYGLRACSMDELLADPEIDIIVNLTIPTAHLEVNLAIIEAGKHVYTEKPLALTREDGQRILAAAEKAGVRVGCAPDTFLGGGLQTCRKLIDDGWIGEPLNAVAFMAGHGPESWHPNPFFFYQFGAGPLFDMAPYYLTALMHMLGPVRRVSGTVRASMPERIATSEALYGQRIPVEVPTHVTSGLDFESGAVGTLITSFDVWRHNLPRIEIYGSEGTLSMPDPNTFGGPVRLWQVREGEWRDIPLLYSNQISRGAGLADMAYGLLSGRPHRANGEMGMHVLDIMQSIVESSEAGQHVTLNTGVDRPAPLPAGLLDGVLD